MHLSVDANGPPFHLLLGLDLYPLKSISKCLVYCMEEYII